MRRDKAGSGQKIDVLILFAKFPKPKMDRSQVYRIVDEERNYQDMCRSNWEHNGVPSVEAELLLMEEYILEARKAWKSNTENIQALDMLRKCVGIGIRCFENHGVPSRTPVQPSQQPTEHPSQQSEEQQEEPENTDDPNDGDFTLQDLEERRQVLLDSLKRCTKEEREDIHEELRAISEMNHGVQPSQQPSIQPSQQSEEQQEPDNTDDPNDGDFTLQDLEERRQTLLDSLKRCGKEEREDIREELRAISEMV